MELQGYTNGQWLAVQKVRNFQQSPVQCAIHPVHMVSVDDLKGRIDVLLASAGKTHADLWSAIKMSESGYFRMLKRGSMDVRTLLAISEVLKVEPGDVLASGTPPAPTVVAEPMRRPYIEDRVEWLETEVRKLKTQIKNL